MVQDVWNIYRQELGVVPEMLFSFLGMPFFDLLLMTFGLFGVKTPRLVYFERIPKLGVLLLLAALPFLEEVCYVFVAGVWEAELLVVRLRVGCIGSVMMMMLISIVLSILLTPLFLLFYSFVGVLSPSLMFLRVLGTRGLLSLGGMLY